MQALQHIVVLDLTQNLPGPYCSRLLADSGARILKLEPPQHGDSARRWPSFFASLHFNQESLCFNLKAISSRELLFSKLLPHIDIFLEGFRPGVCQELGLSYEDVQRYRPDILYCSLSAYGQKGSFQKNPAHDLNIQSLSGLCEFWGDHEEALGDCPLPLADLFSSYSAFASITSALYQRSQTGKGAYLDIAMLDALVHATALWHKTIPKAEEMNAKLPPFLQRGWWGKKIRASKRFQAYCSKTILQLMPHYGLFPTADGKKLAIGIVFEQHFWKDFCEILGDPFIALKDLSLLQRIQRSRRLKKQIQKKIRTRSLQDWLTLFQEKALPLTPTLKVNEMAHSPLFQEKKMFFELQGEQEIRSPFLREIPAFCSVPRLGQQNESILEEFGFSPAEIQGFYEEKALFKAEL
jgi:alpha-methylacyl-CoA racemase